MSSSGALPSDAPRVAGSAGTIRAINPATGEWLEPSFALADHAEMARLCELAAAAFDTYREAAPELRARFLEAIAEQIESLGGELIDRAMAETALPRARLEGERNRTCYQLRMFAAVVRAGDAVSARIDFAVPERKPLPRVDLRMRRIALGPVAVFGASNFPLAFSVAGGDTASALAAGCPVVVKAHPAHPGTSSLAAEAIRKAVAQCGLPEGVFSLLFAQNDVAGALVAHPHIQAVGFTGSRAGGMALLRIAQARPQPIPVYGELSAVNPVFLLPEALVARGAVLGQQFVASLTLGAGQFCTNPGLLFALDSPGLDAFANAAVAALRNAEAQTMLTPGIHASYVHAVERLASESHVQCLARGPVGSALHAAQAGFYATDAASFMAQPVLHEEVFGATGLLVRCKNESDMVAAAQCLEGQLTATLHMEDDDIALARTLLPVLERKAGRIIANGWPTGVEVCDAMVHGGPWPATTDARSTSVGTAAIERFLRPVCYQDMSAELLPAALQNGNPQQLRRLVDGSWH